MGLVALAWKVFGSQTTSANEVCLVSCAERYNAFSFLFFFLIIDSVLSLLHHNTTSLVETFY